MSVLIFKGQISMTLGGTWAHKPPLKLSRNCQRLANPYDQALEIKKKKKTDSDFFTYLRVLYCLILSVGSNSFNTRSVIVL